MTPERATQLVGQCAKNANDGMVVKLLHTHKDRVWVESSGEYADNVYTIRCYHLSEIPQLPLAERLLALVEKSYTVYKTKLGTWNWYPSSGPAQDQVSTLEVAISNAEYHDRTTPKPS